MRYLLDTDTLSLLTRLRPPPELLRRADAVPSHELAASSVTLAEMLYGAHHNRERSADIFGRIQRVLGSIAILPFDEDAADEYGWLRAHLRSRGAPIGDMDTLIAATALAHGLALVTGNVRHFGRVPGLEVENWIA